MTCLHDRHIKPLILADLEIAGVEQWAFTRGDREIHAAEIGERVVAAIAPEMRTLIASRQVGGRRTTDPKEGTP